MNAARINQIIIDAHTNSVEKGWWPEGEVRDEQEMFALMHSEVSEATEAARDGKLSMYFLDSGKPEGYIVELADTAIRAADFLGKRGYKCTVSEEEAKELVLDVSDMKFSPIAMCNRMHVGIAKASEAPEKNHPMVHMGVDMDKDTGVEGVMWGCYIVAKMLGLNLDEAIDKKMAYNKTRPHRHGGKLA
jgi:hypothetical protein